MLTTFIHDKDYLKKMAFQRKPISINAIHLLSLFPLLLNIIGCKIQEPAPKIIEPIRSSTPWSKIKNDLGDCTTKKGPGGINQEHCYIRNVPEVTKYFKEEQTKAGKNCKTFKLSDFSSTTPSIMYGESQGRVGNQLLGYAMLKQLRYT